MNVDYNYSINNYEPGGGYQGAPDQQMQYY
jgi:hypothetical protein